MPYLPLSMEWCLEQERPTVSKHHPQPVNYWSLLLNGHVTPCCDVSDVSTILLVACFPLSDMYCFCLFLSIYFSQILSVRSAEQSNILTLSLSDGHDIFDTEWAYK